MGSYGGEPPGALVSGALAELRQLTREPLFADVERTLLALGQGADGPAGSGSGSGPDAVRHLRRRSAEYQRAALGLEAAARCCRLVEREIDQHADAILSENSRGLAGQFRDIFRWTRSGTRYTARRQEPIPGGPRPEPPAEPSPVPSPRARARLATPAGPRAVPAPVPPDADADGIAAWGKAPSRSCIGTAVTASIPS